MRRATGPRFFGPYQHGDKWRIHIVTGSGGARKTDYETFATRTLAEAFLAGARDEAQGVTVRAAVDAFLERKRGKSLAATTIENYEHRLWRLLGLPGNANRPIRWIASRGAELYQASAFGAGDTHINGLNVGRMFGAFCVKERYLKANPFAGVEAQGRKRKGSEKERLTVNESRMLEAYCFAHATEQDAVLTYGYLMLGKRASELVGVTTRDLDDDGWLVRIRRAKSEASVGGVAVPERLREMLLALANARCATMESGLAHEVAQRWLAAQSESSAPFLFVNQSGAPMSRFVARDRVRAVCKAAGVPVLPPQALRRTFTDNASRQGFSLRSIAEMAGHTSAAVTQRSYAAPEQVEAARVERNLKVLQGGMR